MSSRFRMHGTSAALAYAWARWRSAVRRERAMIVNDGFRASAFAKVALSVDHVGANRAAPGEKLAR